MPHESYHEDAAGWQTRRVWYFWLAVVVLILARAALQPQRNNCFPCYREGGLNWYENNDLYQVVAGTCRYSPAIHAFLVPFSLVPESLGHLVWRLVESILLLSALAWWLKTAVAPALTDRQRAGLLFITVPLLGGNLYSGQANALVMAGILTAMAAVNQSRWTIAAIALAVSCHFKIYPLALAMLLVVLYPKQLGWRLMLTLWAGAALPFLLKDPDYAIRQYQRWLGNLLEDDRSAADYSVGYRDAWLLIRYVGLPIEVKAYRIFSVAVGAAVGLLVIALRWRGDNGRILLNRVLGLGCCWMTVLGPATEGHTYIFLGPTVAWLTIEGARGALPNWARWPINFATLGFLGTFVVVMFPMGKDMPWLIWQPLSALVMFPVLVFLAILDPVRDEAIETRTVVLPSRQAWGSAA